MQHTLVGYKLIAV